MKFSFVPFLCVCLIVLLLVGPVLDIGGLVAPVKPTAVTYVYEKDDSVVPSPVAAALDKLNRQGIMATRDEVDTTDGTDPVPDQYKVSRPAAVAAGLPSLVVMAGDKVLRVVKSPTTEAQVMEAAQ